MMDDESVVCLEVCKRCGVGFVASIETSGDDEIVEDWLDGEIEFGGVPSFSKGGPICNDCLKEKT